MTNSNIIFIGLDTANEYSEVGYVADGYDQKPALMSRIRSTKQDVEKLARQLQSKFAGAMLIFTYEAGPCGYWIYRILTKLGHQCFVVAPSIPKKTALEKNG